MVIDSIWGYINSNDQFVWSDTLCGYSYFNMALSGSEALDMLDYTTSARDSLILECYIEYDIMHTKLLPYLFRDLASPTDDYRNFKNRPPQLDI
ncbi:MAG: hypothetical protein AAFN93_07880 [Bacteroidota bacterium]